MIYFTSDLHFNHNREFIYKSRGFVNVWDMNKEIVDNWNSKVKDNDIVYVLGDLMLGNNEKGKKFLTQLKGDLHIILGNHDTDARIEIYKNLYNTVDVKYADRIKYGKYIFYLSHYPSKVTNKKDKPIWCLHGHTHSKNKFEYPQNYNVSLDAHNMKLVSIEEVIHDIERKR